MNNITKALGLGMFGLLGLARVALAEPITVNYTEPIESATLAHTTVYWCRGASCTNWVRAAKHTSDDGNGSDEKSTPILVELAIEELPLTVRVKVTATNVSGNTNAGTIVTHTFTGP